VTYRREKELLWPASDVGAWKVAHSDAGSLGQIYKHCRSFDVAVQAGGCCGLWPLNLSLQFRLVYTFEPDAVNFRCLCHNAPAENVFKFNAALGGKHISVDLERRSDNIGAHKIGGEGDIPTLRIDDLALRACDLICLDIEGHELNALMGAQETIAEFLPTIVVEDKGVLIPAGRVVSWLSAFGYSVAEKIGRDVVLTAR
jgi:FkbM family methyltransferase